MLPQVNATLLSISTQGTSADWDQTAGPPSAPKWSGEGDAYVIEKMRTNFAVGAGGLSRVKDTSIIIPSDLVDSNGNALTIEGGDIFVFTFQDVTHTRRVSDENSADLPSLAVQQYVRVHFNNDPVEMSLEGQ